MRSKNFNNIVLLVCIDADIHSVSDRYKELDDKCVKEKIPNRTSLEPFAFFVSKRNIETWIEWLENKKGINEVAFYPHRKKNLTVNLKQKNLLICLYRMLTCQRHYHLYRLHKKNITLG